MKLIIDIPKDIVESAKSNPNYYPTYHFEKIWRAIANGMPLPKGHGDLIDRNDLLKHYDSTTYHNGIEERKIHFVQIGYVNDAPTIIEADKAERTDT